MNKRLISYRDEEILKLCHHDFSGLTTVRTAEKLGITASAIRQALKKMEKKIPTMFPILTPKQKRMHDLLDSGLSLIQVAELTDTTEGNVGAFVTKLRKKGHHLNRRLSTVCYQNWMDGQIKEKF